MHQSHTILNTYRNDMYPNQEVKQFSKPQCRANLWSCDQFHSHITREMIEETHLPPQTLKPGVQFDRCFATKASLFFSFQNLNFLSRI